MGSTLSLSGLEPSGAMEAAGLCGSRGPMDADRVGGPMHPVTWTHQMVDSKWSKRIPERESCVIGGVSKGYGYRDV